MVSCENLADLGTRPYSGRENGLGWMQGIVQELVRMEILKPYLELGLKRELEDEYNKGLMIESQISEILTMGHAVNQSRLSLLEEQSKFSISYCQPNILSKRLSEFIASFAVLYRKRERIVS